AWTRCCVDLARCAASWARGRRRPFTSRPLRPRAGSGGAVAETQEHVPLAEDGNEVEDPRPLRQRAVRQARLLLDGLLWHPATESRDEALGYLTGERVFRMCVDA